MSAGVVCYLCGNAVEKDHAISERRYTRDHIMARVWMKDLSAKDQKFHRGAAVIGVKVTKPCCQTCNWMRSDMGHCAGLVRMAIVCADPMTETPRGAALRVGLYPPRLEGRRALLTPAQQKLFETALRGKKFKNQRKRIMRQMETWK